MFSIRPNIVLCSQKQRSQSLQLQNIAKQRSLIPFKTWITPFIERKSHFVKGAFPLGSNDNDKGPLIHDQNWKSSFHIVVVVVSRTKSLFLHMNLKMWPTIFLLLFKLEWNVWNWLAGKFLQLDRGFFFFFFLN